MELLQVDKNIIKDLRVVASYSAVDSKILSPNQADDLKASIDRLSRVPSKLLLNNFIGYLNSGLSKLKVHN